jgi:hypothetical protein
MSIADLQLPIANWFQAKRQSEIGNPQLAIVRPTGYRLVVLTSRPTANWQMYIDENRRTTKNL